MTELIWDGKYDKDGRKVAPLRVKLPFQTVETINESAQERQRTLDLFGSNRPPEWRNRLIWVIRNMCYLPCWRNLPARLTLFT